ncbi:MAG: ABC transporter substrate-binding protein [Hydrogenibacillus schlegelii]|nr:ABC transporter substrate-binding protein [Hydrogenibacillus schlegelii]
MPWRHPGAFRGSLIMLAAAIALAGCGGKPTSSPAGEATSGEGDKEQKAQTVLVYARGGDSVSLDPATVTDEESLRVTKNILEPLLQYAPDSFEVRPALAERWEVSDDGLVYTFYLRKGVKFHDGTDFNADAVVYNFKRWTNPNDPHYAEFEYYQSQFGDLIEDVVAIDDHTVQFRLKERQAPFLQNIAMDPFAIASPTALEKYGADFGRHPVGTGPFVFKEWKPKQSITLERNPDYWGGAPKLERIVFTVIEDNSARLQALKSGDVDLIDGVLPSDIKTLKADGRFQVWDRPPNNVGYLGFNTKKAPFDDPRVRQAVAHAIDKPALIAAFYSDQAEPAKNPMPPTIAGYNDSIEDYPFDLEKAKSLIQASGYDGREVLFYAMPVYRPYMPNGPKIAEAIQANLSAIGLKSKIVSPEWAVYLDETKQGKADLFLLGWIGDNGDPDNYLYVLLDKDNAGGSNRTFYDNEDVHRLLTQAQKELDPDKRAALYREAQEIIHRDVPMVPLIHSISSLAGKPTIKGFTPHPGGSDKLTDVYFEK